MNKFFNILLLLLIIFTGVFAQKGLKIDAGYNWTKFVGRSENLQKGGSFGLNWRYI